MAKVFKITEGLENLGALKTGGQGSVYKGKRIGPIITAIKILPTPIYSESADDKNFTSFQNEVEKLKKVNEHPNPNVVTILDSGITDSGNFPFIEMEYIEGPDLGELLNPPHDPVFSIKETIKVAEHLSNALAHCHSANVKHGDIKSNNVKFNNHTGNYILLDFGLSVMSDEQRRTSFRHAGAIEFMAPEQNEGEMLFETDVYSFGVIIYELLAGTVPFPLKDGGETSRNTVMVAHMETNPPDLLALRMKAMPESWDEEKRNSEMKVPTWLLDMVYKCLEKKPADRFANGNKVHQYIIEHALGLHATIVSKKTGRGSIDIDNQAALYKQKTEQQNSELKQLREIIQAKDEEIDVLRNNVYRHSSTRARGIPINIFITVLILLFALGGYASYKFWQDRRSRPQRTESSSNNSSNIDTGFASTSDTPGQINDEEQPRQEDTGSNRRRDAPPLTNDQINTGDTTVSEDDADDNSNASIPDPTNVQEPSSSAKSSGQYTVVNIAHLHDAPDERSRRSAFITPSTGAFLTSIDDQNGYIYVEFTNSQGQTSKGWLSKKDLKPVNDL